MFDHVSVGVTNLGSAQAFYDAVMQALGHVCLFQNPRAACYGPPGFTGEAPFAILQLADPSGEPAGNPARADGKAHYAFAATSRVQVDAFYAAALANGGSDDGPPGIRHNYHPGYYAAFVRDPDGRRLEAVFHERLLEP